MRHPFSPLGLALCTVACSFASGVCASERFAADANFVFLASSAPQATAWKAVGDDVLAQQTGKYAGASMISGFVLNVLSQWHLPNGAVASALGSLAVTASADGKLAAHVATEARVLDGTGAGMYMNPHAVASGGQSVSVSGVSQVTQVAGDNNVGTNLATIDFNGANTPPLPGGNSPSAAASNATGSIKASVAFGNGGVTVALQTPVGVASQSIASNNGQQAGSIAQLLQIAGSGQIVTNQLQLSLSTQRLSGAGLRQLGVLQALQNAAFVRR